MSKYSIIYADPPWSYRDKCNAGKRGACHKYDVMNLDDICALDVPAADDSMLYLWATPPMLLDAIRVMQAWGFTYKTIAFPWLKTTKTGKLAWGMGHYSRANAEIVLLGKRGKGVPVIDHGVHSVVMSERMKHSQKPDEVAERIVRMHGDVPRLEMFARRRMEGWDVFGNQVDGSIEIGRKEAL